MSTIKRVLRKQKSSDVVLHLVGRVNKDPIFNKPAQTLLFTGFKVTLNEDTTRDIEIHLQDREEEWNKITGRLVTPQMYKPGDFAIMQESEEVK